MKSLTALLLVVPSCLVLGLPQSNGISFPYTLNNTDTSDPLVQAAAQSFGADEANDPEEPNPPFPRYLWSYWNIDQIDPTRTWTSDDVGKFIAEAIKAYEGARGNASAWTPVPNRAWSFSSDEGGTPRRFYINQAVGGALRPLVWYDVNLVLNLYAGLVKGAKYFYPTIFTYGVKLTPPSAVEANGGLIRIFEDVDQVSTSKH